MQHSTSKISSVTIYAAASNIIPTIYFDQAKKLGSILARNGIKIVYGAGNTGLMGTVANAVLEGNGKVVGVIPKFMHAQNWHLEQCTELIVTEDMHARKKIMCEMGDAIIALPGGVGTMEELLEAITWKQLSLDIAKKPIIIFNINHYYDHLIQMLETSIDQNFMSKQHANIFVVMDDADQVMDILQKQFTSVYVDGIHHVKELLTVQENKSI